MAQWELHSSRPQRYSVALAHRLDSLCPLDEGNRRRPVVVARPWFGLRQDAAVQHARGDDGHAAVEACGQELMKRHLVEKRVAAREQEAVEVALAREAREHFRLVHAGAD